MKKSTKETKNFGQEALVKQLKGSFQNLKTIADYKNYNASYLIEPITKISEK